MPKAIFYVFSGTGNSLLVANLYKKYFTKYETEVFEVAHLTPDTPIPNPNDYDLVGLGYPVHGFNAPKVFTDFCKNLPEITGEAKKVFVAKTSGEGLGFNNYSSQKILRFMEKKNYKFICERHFVMPYNMIFRHSPEMVKSEYIYADALARLNASQIENGLVEKVKRSPIKGWFVPIVRIEWIYAQLQGPFMKVNTKKCIKCMKCVKICPLDNIKFQDEKFSFGTNCALCVRCSFNCPTSAISIGLLNNWKINGDYHIEATAKDESIQFPYFTKQYLKGIKRWAYLRYYKRLDKMFEENNISLKLSD